MPSKLEVQLREVQQKLDLISIYNQIIAWVALPVDQNKVPDEILKTALNDIQFFCKRKIEEIEGSTIEQEPSEEDLTETEKSVLKHFVKGLLEKSTGTPVPSAPHSQAPELKTDHTIDTPDNKGIIGKKARVICLGNIDPANIIDRVVGEDVVTILDITPSNFAKVNHDREKILFNIPLDDLEVI